MRMDTVNNDQITILGAVILNIAGQSQGGTEHKTKQIVMSLMNWTNFTSAVKLVQISV